MTEETYSGVCLRGPYDGKKLTARVQHVTLERPTGQAPNFYLVIIGTYTNHLNLYWTWEPR